MPAAAAAAAEEEEAKAAKPSTHGHAAPTALRSLNLRQAVRRQAEKDQVAPGVIVPVATPGYRAVSAAPTSPL